jgi:small subunit ribosomal protein S21
MLRMELKSGEPMDKALRRFKKLCNREGITRDMRRKSNFEKPSEIKKREKREQERARAKLLRQDTKQRVKARDERKKNSRVGRDRTNVFEQLDAEKKANS